VTRNRKFILAGLLVALLLAGIVSNFASSQPDGLDSVALKGCTVSGEGKITSGDCPARHEKANQTERSPLAGYGIRGIDNPYLSTGLAGVLGVGVTFGIGAGLFWLARRRRAGSPT
jgi:cobalt/nickel transport protein